MKRLSAISISILLITLVEAQQANQFYVDSLKQKLATAKEDTNKVHLLMLLGEYYGQASADTGVLYCQQAVDLAKRIDFESVTVEAEGGLALTLIFSGNYPLGLDHAFKVVALAKKTLPERVPWACSLVAYGYYYLGDYDAALRYTREAVAKGAEWEMPYGWRDLSTIFHNLNQTDSAMINGLKAFEKLKGSPAEGNISHILADAYLGKGMNDSAVFYYHNAILALGKFISQTDLIDTYNGLANVYKATNHLDSAVWYSRVVIAQNIAKSYPVGLLTAINMLASVYEGENKSDSALKYLRSALVIKDSLFSRDKTLAVQNLAYKEQEKQKEIEAASLKYQNHLKLYSLLGGLVVLIIIAVILFINNKNRQKAYDVLQHQKQETDTQKLKAEEALTDLKAAQTQLVHSEKMASLGELTAGIAHEIQNPLNFVNNFSEVNKELIEELKVEKLKGKDERDEKLENELLSTIEQNLEKINFHGKRADGIVKGMLMHSRTSSGQKELTDINTLADEYLRLAYHGLRAKNKSFNAKFEADLDPTLEKISVVPQDIGRVLLNLINNAFYAVSSHAKTLEEAVAEKSPEHSSIGNYEPTVTISTKSASTASGNPAVRVTVRDNGAGIPQAVLEKIFQPFFTTKPTGQGTGLGLSLSYDIVKAHGGELRVETREGEYTEFIILLPS